MKTTKFYTILSIIMLTIVFTSCVEDDDFTTPDVSIIEPNISTDATVAKFKTDLIQEYNLNGNLTYTYRENETPTYVSGYVVSSDAAGNFYQTLVVQDAIENPTAGLEIMINNSTLSQTYEVGRKVYIKIDGLSVTYDDGQSSSRINPTDNEPGKFSVGIIDHTGQVENIPSTTYRDYIVRSASIETIVPTSVKRADLEEKHVNTLIKLESAQFAKDQIGKTFSDELNDSFDGFRTIFECDTEDTMLLQTSTFASFSSNKIPTGKGSATTILSKDFRAEFFVLIVSSPADLDFSNQERCDPLELDCGLATSQGNNILFDDMFETQTRFSPISGNGWTNFQEAGTETWEAYTAGGSNASQGISARVGSFRSGDASTIAWLITPEIDLDVNTGVTLSFETSNSFADQSNLELLFSSDWDGTAAGVTTATWGVLPAAYLVQDSDSFSPWFESGLVDLSCGSGKIHIAFKYTGNGDSGFDGTYELDNIKIASN